MVMVKYHCRVLLIIVFLILLLVLYLVQGALSVCPESFTETCLLPAQRLQQYVRELPPLAGFYTAYNESELINICRYKPKYGITTKFIISC